MLFFVWFSVFLWTMPRMCCVNECDTNYHSSKKTKSEQTIDEQTIDEQTTDEQAGDEQTEKISVFRFPKDPTKRALWIKSIPRKDFIPNDDSVVCSKHFLPSQISKFRQEKGPGGVKRDVPRKVPMLTADAFPCIFPGLHPRFSIEVPTKRKAPEERAAEYDAGQEAVFDDFMLKDRINSFEEFLTKFKEKDLLRFDSRIFPDHVWFFAVEFSGVLPQVTVSFKVSSDLKLFIYFGDFEVPFTKYDQILKAPNYLCDRWTIFETMVSQLNGEIPLKLSKLTVNEKMLRTNTCIDEVIQELKSDDSNKVKVNKFRFLKEQLNLCLAKKIQYSTDTFLWACTVSLSFPGAYTLLRKSEVLTLPHPVHIKSVTGNIKTDVGLKPAQKTYLKQRCSKLQEHEKVVNLTLDEINVKPQLQYQGGAVKGAAMMEGAIEAATKIQSFMIHSVFSKYDDIVGLFPIKYASGELLFKWTLEVLKALTEADFTILSIICDNYKMNGKMYRLLSEKFARLNSDPDAVLQEVSDTEMSDELFEDEAENGEEEEEEEDPSKWSISFQNPYRPSDTIFLLFDNVHLLKSVRNCWLNQRDARQTLLYPSFDDENLILQARFSDVKDVYFAEKEKVVKLAPNLSQKVVFPQSFERQNVLLACKLFDEKTREALKKVKETDVPFNGAAEFIRIIMIWWNIINVRCVRSGYNLRDPTRAAIRSPDDNNVDLLRRFCTWLDSWKNCKVAVDRTARRIGGRLTKETHAALHHTTRALIALITYVFTVFQIQYLLLGKFQTDKLEGRFGWYRQLCGANYNISVKEVLDAERKIKVLKLLKMRSSFGGTFSLKYFTDEQDEAQEEELKLDSMIDLYEALELCDNITLSSNDKRSLFYIAGYVAHSLLKYLHKCKSCTPKIASEEEFSVEFSEADENISDYLKNLCRGGLKQPTALTFKIVVEMYKLFCTLISENFEQFFIQSPSQRQILKSLAFSKIEEFDFNMDEKCKNEKCNKTLSEIVVKSTHVLSNIFLNNYCKIVNDRKRSSIFTEESAPDKKKARKLQTLNPARNEAGPSQESS